jgi:hypothetical protein
MALQHVRHPKHVPLHRQPEERLDERLGESVVEPTSQEPAMRVVTLGDRKEHRHRAAIQAYAARNERHERLNHLARRESEHEHAFTLHQVVPEERARPLVRRRRLIALCFKDLFPDLCKTRDVRTFGNDSGRDLRAIVEGPIERPS